MWRTKEEEAGYSLIPRIQDSDKNVTFSLCYEDIMQVCLFKSGNIDA
jgi:hypothetical protein